MAKPDFIWNFEKQNQKKMTYQIQITPSKQSEFLQIVDTLKKLGVVENYQRSESYVTPGDSVAIDTLLQTLEESENQTVKGLSFTTAEAKIFLKAWQQRKK